MKTHTQPGCAKGTREPLFFREDDVFSVVVPETTGTLLIGFWDDGEDGVTHVTHPVVAWRVRVMKDDEITVATPVLCEELPEVWCLKQSVAGEHRWVFPWHADFDTFNGALDYATEQLQAANQRRAG